MKKIMLLALGLSLFAVSCNKKETLNENNSMSDSTSTGTMSPDNTTTGTSMDTTASVRDSAMNQGAGNSNNAATDGTNGSNRSGSGSDSAR